MGSWKQFYFILLYTFINGSWRLLNEQALLKMILLPHHTHRSSKRHKISLQQGQSVSLVAASNMDLYRQNLSSTDILSDFLRIMVTLPLCALKLDVTMPHLVQLASMFASFKSVRNIQRPKGLVLHSSGPEVSFPSLYPMSTLL